MITLNKSGKRKPLKRIFLFATVIFLITVLSQATLFSALSVNNVTPSDHCEGGDCCIRSECSCPNCEGRGVPGGICEDCGDDLCTNCGNCCTCGTSPCPECRNQINEVSIDDEPVPLIAIGNSGILLFAPFGVASWAISNLLLTAAGLVCAFIVILKAVRNKRNENSILSNRINHLSNRNLHNNEYAIEMIGSHERSSKRRRLSLMTVMYVLSFGSVALLMVFQNFRGIIALFDWLTAIHILLFAGVLVSGGFVFRKKQNYAFKEVVL